MAGCKGCKYFEKCGCLASIVIAIDVIRLKEEYEGKDKGLYDDLYILIAKYCSEYEKDD